MKWHARSDEHRTAHGARSTSLQPGDKGIANVARERKPVLAIAFASNSDFPPSPIEITQL